MEIENQKALTNFPSSINLDFPNYKKFQYENNLQDSRIEKGPNLHIKDKMIKQFRFLNEKNRYKNDNNKLKNIFYNFKDGNCRGINFENFKNRREYFDNVNISTITNPYIQDGEESRCHSRYNSLGQKSVNSKTGFILAQNESETFKNKSKESGSSILIQYNKQNIPKKFDFTLCNEFTFPKYSNNQILTKKANMKEESNFYMDNNYNDRKAKDKESLLYPQNFNVNQSSNKIKGLRKGKIFSNVFVCSNQLRPLKVNNLQCQNDFENKGNTQNLNNSCETMNQENFTRKESEINFKKSDVGTDDSGNSQIEENSLKRNNVYLFRILIIK